MIWVALAGGCGAVARYLSDGLIMRNRKQLRGWATLTINIVGSLFLGLLVGWCLSNLGHDELRMILGVGFLGGYTTFSTACVEAARLVLRKEYRTAALLVVTMLIGSVFATAFGLWVFLS
ncbi:MAG: CrcB family protein [Propionibacteriaceae bacterium]|jgi:CrcB protein|nr:CrcB family protein [Propionibacteriaceae bacterium]